MFDWLGKFISRHWLAVLLVWGVAATAIHVLSPRWDQVTHDGDLAYLPANMPSVQGELLMAKAFPDQKVKSSVAIVVARQKGPLTETDLEWVDGLSDAFEKDSARLTLLEVWNHNTEVVGEKLLSKVTTEGQATVILLHLANEFAATDNVHVLENVEKLLAEYRQRNPLPDNLQLGITGSAALGADVLNSTAESIRNTEKTTIMLVICILLVVYRAPVLVSLPLFTIALSLTVGTDLLAALTQLNRVPGFEWWNFKIFTTTKIFIVVILFGAGTDFCLFLISRFKEELDRGLAPEAAVAESVKQVGEALVGSCADDDLRAGHAVFRRLRQVYQQRSGDRLDAADYAVGLLDVRPGFTDRLWQCCFLAVCLASRENRRRTPLHDGPAATDDGPLLASHQHSGGHSPGPHPDM